MHGVVTMYLQVLGEDPLAVEPVSEELAHLHGRPMISAAVNAVRSMWARDTLCRRWDRWGGLVLHLAACSCLAMILGRMRTSAVHTDG